MQMSPGGRATVEQLLGRWDQLVTVVQNQLVPCHRLLRAGHIQNSANKQNIDRVHPEFCK